MKITRHPACVHCKDSDQPDIRPVWSESLQCTQWVAKDPRLFFFVQTARLWSDWADALADLSLCWAHMLFCRFCHVLAHICKLILWFCTLVILSGSLLFIDKSTMITGDSVTGQWSEPSLSDTGRDTFLDGFFKNLSFKIAMSGQTGIGHRPRFTFWLTLFSKLYVTFILLWIAFIFDRDEEEDQ